MDRKPSREIVFVCTGNTCRSPMAEYLLRHRVGPKSPWTISSAGVFAANGSAASLAAVEVLQELGIDLAPHRSRCITKDIIDAATMIVVMTAAHALELRSRYPESQDRTYLLKSFGRKSGGGDVRDPVGGSAATYRVTRDEIDAALLDLILYLKQFENNKPGSDLKDS